MRKNNKRKKEKKKTITATKVINKLCYKNVGKFSNNIRKRQKL